MFSLKIGCREKNSVETSASKQCALKNALKIMLQKQTRNNAERILTVATTMALKEVVAIRV